MIYTSDPTAIRDAKKDVDDAKLEIQKQSIQDQIDALDDEIDRYNDLIDQINKAADERIDALEREKNKWQEVIDQQEYAQNLLLLTGEFGADAITKILTGNDDDLLEQWKNSYINTLTDIDMESQGHIGNMTEQIASLYDVDLSSLQDQFQGVSDSVSGMTDALSEAANAIGIGNVSDNAASPNAPEGTSAPSTGTESSLESAIKSETDTAMTSFDQHTDKLTNEVIPAIQSATAEMIAFNEAADLDIEKTVTISYVAMGDKPSVGDNIAVGKAHAEGTTGKAFANGTGKYKGLSKAEKNALVSEYGQTEMTVLPNGNTIITDEPTMMDLPKDTVIYNEEQTKKIMDNKASVSGNAHADGTNDGWWIGSDGHRYRNIQPGDRSYELQKAFEPLLNKWLSGEQEILSNAVFDGQKQMERWTKEITNNTAINNVTANNKPSVSIGDIYVTCPGVTEQQVAERIGSVLGRELDKQFSGFHNYADQMIRIR